MGMKINLDLYRSQTMIDVHEFEHSISDRSDSSIDDDKESGPSLQNRNACHHCHASDAEEKCVNCNRRLCVQCVPVNCTKCGAPVCAAHSCDRENYSGSNGAAWCEVCEKDFCADCIISVPPHDSESANFLI